MSNVEKEDECEYCNVHLKWEDEASELDEDEAREVDEEVGEVEDREINSGGRNSNEVGDKIIETRPLPPPPPPPPPPSPRRRKVYSNQLSLHDSSNKINVIAFQGWVCVCVSLWK
jgi:hypothetical protein